MSSTESARDVSDVVLTLTDTLGAEFDPAGLLYDLVVACVQLLDIDAAGVLLLDQRGHPVPVAATDNAAGHLDQVQSRTELGPCPESVRGDQAVSCADLERDGDRWPDFTRTARDHGFRAVHALPLSLRDQTIGGINLLRRAPGGSARPTGEPARCWPPRRPPGSCTGARCENSTPPTASSEGRSPAGS